MDIGFEPNSWLQAPATRAFAGDWSAAPEWLALQSRLTAAWSARRQLAADSGTTTLRSGSFDSGAALALARLDNCSRAVNPIASANRKPASGMDDHHAGDLTSGGRG